MSEMMQVPDGWEVKLSSELCKNIADGTHDTPQPSFFGFKLVTSKNLKDNKLDFEDCYLISEEDYIAINKRSQVKQYDILFGMIGTIGNPVIILDKNIDFTIKNVGLFRFNGDYELSKWFYYYLSSEQFKSYLDFVLSGSSQKFVSLGILRTLPILIPKEKKEQEKIAKILSTLDKAIESTNRLIEKEKNIKTALMQELLTNGIDQNGKIRSSKTHTYKQSELGLIPDEWEVVSLDDFFKLKSGDTKPEDTSNNGIYEVYGGNGITGYSNVKNNNEQTLIIGRVGEYCGSVYLVNECWITDNALYITKKIKKFDTKYMFYLLYFLNLNQYKSETGQPLLNQTIIGHVKTTYPRDFEEQKQIAKILTAQDKKIKTEETNIVKLKELKKGLMNGLLSGKVRVKI